MFAQICTKYVVLKRYTTVTVSWPVSLTSKGFVHFYRPDNYFAEDGSIFDILHPEQKKFDALIKLLSSSPTQTRRPTQKMRQSFVGLTRRK